MTTADADSLRKTVYEQLERCRATLKAGAVNMQPVQESVRVYCEALAELPRSVLTAHKADLEEMTLQLNALSETLVAEREGIRAQLDGLGKLRKANIAYQTSDSIGGVTRKKESN
jgi:hypothetical protein